MRRKFGVAFVPFLGINGGTDPVEMRTRTNTYRRARRQGRQVEELTEDVCELIKRGVLQPNHADAGVSAGGTRQVSDKVLITQNETTGRIAGDAMTM